MFSVWRLTWEQLNPSSLIKSYITVQILSSLPEYYPLILKCPIFSVKNMTWILRKISFHFMSQIHDSLVQIDSKFHDYSMSFIQLLFDFHAGTWHGSYTSLSHGISMTFTKKMMGSPPDLVSFSTKLPSK